MLNQHGCVLLGNWLKISNLITPCRRQDVALEMDYCSLIVQMFLRVVHLLRRHLTFFCTDTFLEKLEAFVGDGVMRCLTGWGGHGTTPAAAFWQMKHRQCPSLRSNTWDAAALSSTLLSSTRFIAVQSLETNKNQTVVNISKKKTRDKVEK